MIGRLIRVELRQALRDPRIRWLPLAILLACLPAFIAGLTGTRRIAGEVDRITAVERARWLNQSPKNPHSADHFGTWLFKPVSPLAALDSGIAPYMGRMIRIEAHQYNDAVFRAIQDANPLMRGGMTSVADIAQLVVPLAMLMLGAFAFAADKERGTIRLALGNGAPPRQWVAARVASLLIAGGGAVALPLTVLGCAAAVLLDGAGWTTGVRLPLWLLAELVQAATFLMLGIAVSLVCRTSRDALAAGLLLWVGLCIVLPRAATSAVEQVAPTPSYQKVRLLIEERNRAFNEGEASAVREQEIMARYRADRPGNLPVDLRGVMLQLRDDHDSGVFDREFGAFFTALDRQDMASGWAGIVSPRSAMDAVSEAIAGNDYPNHLAFVQAAERYRRTLSDTMNRVLIAAPRTEEAEMVSGREVWRLVPAFAYRPAPVAVSLAHAIVPITLLAAWLAVATAFVLVLAVRLKP